MPGLLGLRHRPILGASALLSCGGAWAPAAATGAVAARAHAVALLVATGGRPLVLPVAVASAEIVADATAAADDAAAALWLRVAARFLLFWWTHAELVGPPGNPAGVVSRVSVSATRVAHVGLAAAAGASTAFWAAAVLAHRGRGGAGLGLVPVATAAGLLLLAGT